MNLLKKQGFYNSITLYIGTALGFFNLIILFQRILTPEQVGLFTLITAISLLYTQVAAIGFPNAITRYFPFFKTDDKKHSGFPLYIFKYTFYSFLIVTAFYVFGKEVIFKYNSKGNGSSLFYEYYYLIIPVSLITLFYGLSEAFARTTFHNIFPSFLREILLKIFTTFGVLLIYFQIIGYEKFVYWYVIANAIILFILLFYLKKLDLIRFGAISSEVKKKSPEILKFGLYSMLASGSFAMIQNIDVVFLKLFSSEAIVGYYGTFFGMAVVINLPAKALNTTSYQIIANAWKTEDLEKINKIYSKTSLVQFLIGCLLLVGLITNWQNVLFLLYKPEYANFYGVFIVIGAGFLFDITGGLNGAIISFSKNYKLVMYILVVAAILCAILNIIFIPIFGMLGAAMAYTLTMFVLNFAYWLYLFKRYKLQPFNFNFIKVILIAAISLTVGLLLPYLHNFYLDVVYRSVIVGLIYIGFIRYFKISPDINEFIDQIFNKLSSG